MICEKGDRVEYRIRKLDIEVEQVLEELIAVGSGTYSADNSSTFAAIPESSRLPGAVNRVLTSLVFIARGIESSIFVDSDDIGSEPELSSLLDQAPALAEVFCIRDGRFELRGDLDCETRGQILEVIRRKFDFRFHKH